MDNLTAKSMQQQFGIGGKVVLVTGAGYGVGRASALLLAQAGGTVVAADRDASAARAVADAIVAADGTAGALQVDVTQEESVVALVEQTVAAFGRIDILVNAHTLVGSVALTETSAREWDEVQSVNLRGAFLCMREAIKRMLVQGGGGRIVNVTTIGSLHPVLNGNAAYSSSKAALNMLTKNAALDYAGDGILVNAVLPGAVTLDDATPRFGAAIKSGPGTDKARHLSGGSKPDAVAPAVLFLAGPGGAYITGQLLALDGGFLVS